MMETNVGNRKQQRWIVVLFFLLSGILTATWSSRIPEIQQKLHLSNSALGTVLFAIPAGLIIGLSFASWAVVTFGSRLVMITSCVFCAVFLALAGIVSSALLLVPVLFLLGISRTVLNLSANTGAIEVQRMYQRPIISTFHGIWSLACFAAAGISQALIIFDIWPQYHFPAIAVIAIIAMFVFAQKKDSSQRSSERKPFFVRPDKYLLLLGLMALCAMLCEGAMFDWSVNYFEKVIGAEKSFVTVGYICFIATMTGGRLIGDRLIHFFGAYRLLVICGSLMAVGFVTAAVFPFLATTAAGFFMIGLGDSVLVPLIYILTANSQKMPTSYALSSVTLIGYTGLLIGPPLIGNVSDWWGMPAAFLILSAVSLLVVFLSLQVKKMQ